MPAIDIDVTICGLEMTATMEYRVTIPGHEPCYRDDPEGWPMEFDVEDFKLVIENEFYDAPVWLQSQILDYYDNTIYHAIKDNEGS